MRLTEVTTKGVTLEVILLEQAFRTLYREGAVPTLGALRNDPGSLTALETLLTTFNETLPIRPRSVLERALGLQAAPETLAQIAQDLGVSRERVRAVAQQALERLRKEALRAGLASAPQVSAVDRLAEPAASSAGKRSVALERYSGDLVDQAIRWASLPEAELRRLAAAAAAERDTAALWELTDAYLTLHSAKGAALSPRTRESYRRGIEDLLEDWTGENLLRPRRDAGVVWVRRLESRTVCDPRTGEPKRDAASGEPKRLSPATVQAKLAAARALYRALRWAGASTATPFENVKAAKDPVPAWEKRGAYTPEEVDALLEAAEPPDQVVVLLGAHAGLRVAEIAALRWTDIDGRAKEIVVRRGKGGKTARVAMTRRLREALRELPRDAGEPSGYVLPFRAYRARERFQKLCLRAGVEYAGREVHGLRHGAGTRVYGQFKDLGRVAQHLRQASVDTARRYAKMADKVVSEGIEEW